MKVLKGSVEKCECGSILRYNESDIKKVEMSYGLGTYAGETYIAKIITCPVCGRKIEVY